MTNLSLDKLLHFFFFFLNACRGYKWMVGIDRTRLFLYIYSLPHLPSPPSRTIEIWKQPCLVLFVNGQSYFKTLYSVGWLHIDPGFKTGFMRALCVACYQLNRWILIRVFATFFPLKWMVQKLHQKYVILHQAYLHSFFNSLTWVDSDTWIRIVCTQVFIQPARVIVYVYTIIIKFTNLLA